jgi:hypothetical protein
MSNAIIEIKPGRYFSAIIFVYGDEDRDWLASIYRDSADGPWQLSYRFRYYANNDPWSTKDRKSVYCAEVKGVTEEFLCAQVRTVAEMLVSDGFNTRLDWLDIGSDDVEVVRRRLVSRPWAHMKLAKDMPS